MIYYSQIIFLFCLSMSHDIRCFFFFVFCFSTISRRSVAEVYERFEEEFGKDPLCHPTIYATHRDFIGNGSIHDCSRYGRPKSACSDENIEIVSKMISRSPTTSIRRVSEAGLPTVPHFGF